MRNCDIKNCEKISGMIVDDHGVDVYLCEDHYCEWKAVEKHLKYSLEKWREKHNA